MTFNSCKKIVIFFSVFLMLPVVFAVDSTKTHPSSLTIKKPASIVEQDTLSGIDAANYDSLLDCPLANQLNCRDLNGVLSNPSTAENCPAACKVKDITTTYSVAGVDYVNTFFPGKCPFNYIMATSYKMDKEVIYDAKPSSYPVPIPNQATLDSYKGRAGTVCAPVPPTRSFDHCQTGSPDYKSGMVGFYGGGYSIITDNINTNKCYDKYTCPGPSPLSCSLSTTKRYYKVQYQFFQCTPAAGYFFTGRDAPSRKVCVRKHMIWN